MDSRLLPGFAYAANPYLMAQNAEWLAQSWGLPNLFIPAAPLGFAATPSSYAFQYLTGLPIFQYQPTSWVSLGKTFLGLQYPIYPYATTAETIYGAAIPLAAKTTETGLELLSGLTAMGLFAFAYSKRGSELGLGLLNRLVPGVGSAIGRLRAIPLIGEFLPSMIGGTITSFLTAQPILAAVGWLSEQAGEAVGGTVSIAHSLSRYMIGTSEFEPAVGEITFRTAAELYSKLMETSTEHPLLDRDTLLAVATTAPRLGILESVEPNVDNIVKAIKGISAYLRIISELARDPSMMDTLQRVAEFMEGGATLTQAISFYHQFGIQAMAGGTTLNDIYESILQPVMQAAQQANVLPITGAAAYMSTLPFMHGFAPFVNNSPLQPYFALVGGPQGYSMVLTQEVLRNAYNPIWLMAEHSVGPFGGRGLTPQQYYEWLYNRPVELQREISEVGAPNYIWEQSARIVDMLRRYGITDKGMLYQVAIQLGADPLAVRAILEQQVGTYLHGMAHAKVAEAQARLSDLINTTELETYGIAGKIELAARQLEAFVQHPLSTVTGTLADWWTNLRLETRFYSETMSPIERKLSTWLFGATPEEFERMFHLTKEEQNFYELALHGSAEETAELLKLGLENLPKMKQIEAARDWYPFFGKQQREVWEEVAEKAALYLPDLEHKFHFERYLEEHVKQFSDVGKAVVEFFEEHKKDFVREYGKENLFDIQRILKYAATEYAKERFFKGTKVGELDISNQISEQIKRLFSTSEEVSDTWKKLTAFYTSEQLFEKYGLTTGSGILDFFKYGYLGEVNLAQIVEYALENEGPIPAWSVLNRDERIKRYREHIDTSLVKRVLSDALKHHSPRAIALVAYMQALAKGDYEKAGEIAEKFGFQPEKMRDVRTMSYLGELLHYIQEKRDYYSRFEETKYLLHLAEYFTSEDFSKVLEKGMKTLPPSSTTELLASQAVFHGLEILTGKKIKSPTDETAKVGMQALKDLADFLATYSEYQKTHDLELKKKLQEEAHILTEELAHLPTATARELRAALQSGDYERVRELTVNLFKTSVVLEHPEKLSHLSQAMVTAAEHTHKALEGVVKDLRELSDTLEVLSHRAREATLGLQQAAYGNIPFLTKTSH